MELLDEPYVCPDRHDLPSMVLSLIICVGLIVSYLPQLLRIHLKKSSEGFSPWYLLLGATSSACAMLNLFLVQWPVVRCCKVVSRGMCAENTLGLVQVTFQWFLFGMILVLYMIYFPSHLKYQRTLPFPDDLSASTALQAEQAPLLPQSGATSTYDGVPLVLSNAVLDAKNKVKIQTTPEWRLAVTLAWVTALHLVLLTLLTAVFLAFLPPSHPLLSLYSLVLGLSASLLAALQYGPQIVHTYRSKLVGALSIGTMIIQVPGSVVFCLSLALRPGVGVKAWGVYAVTGLLQLGLLTMCLMWKRRQRRLGVDDFGNQLPPPVEVDAVAHD